MRRWEGLVATAGDGVIVIVHIIVEAMMVVLCNVSSLIKARECNRSELKASVFVRKGGSNGRNY